ncbi:porin family protein [Pontimicrobium aquaticum]|uniref:PorT family protein n=1 Tax=Pontimicrobium aquaticum TaxID=2565367 RepID=A0A4U0ESB5_9FLAO|nr:porin family protein [Pontimicrobium aquaticum]TJY34601.1 PorT family protein [Pontimicrobium aquaticum]
MKQIIIFIIAVCVTQLALAQSIDSTQVKYSIDTKYKEDQYYFGVSYNVLTNMPNDMYQNGFSSGFHLGFIKDMPINKRRNVALGIGLGYSTNSINNNLLITQVADNTYTYELLNDSEFTKNKFVQHLVELPIEFRWRTSTATTYKFWRVYTGIKFGYVFASNTKFKNASNTDKINNIKDFNELQYGLTLAVGYDSWNLFIHYNLNSIFEDKARLNGSSIDTKMLKIGIMFYIL